MRAAPLGTGPNATPSRAATLSECLSLTPLLLRSPTTRHSQEVRDATACKHAASQTEPRPGYSLGRERIPRLSREIPNPVMHPSGERFRNVPELGPLTRSEEHTS